MSFEKFATVLIQFRLAANFASPIGVREVGQERAEDRAKREVRSKEIGPMKNVLERNGASLASIHSKLAESGLVLDDATIQLRTKPAGEWKGEKSYRLLTYVYRRTPLFRGPAPSTKLFDILATQRFEYVGAHEGLDKDGNPLMVILAKTVAAEAKELKESEDPEAAAYGVVVSKSVPKDKRLGANGAQAPDGVAVARVFANRPKQAPKPVEMPPQELVEQMAARKRMDVLPGARIDFDLQRLLQRGWVIEDQDDTVVDLCKNVDGKVVRKTYQRPAAQHRRA